MCAKALCLAFCVGIAVAVQCAAGEVYCWAGGDWGLYSEPSNWRIGSADGAVATSCPGASDSLYSKQDFRFDLGGGNGFVGSWDTTDDWKGDTLSVSNGILTIDTIRTHNGTVEVCNGGTLAVKTKYVFALNDASAHEVYVRNGGELQVLGDAIVYKMAMEVESGGRLLLNPTRFGPSPGTAQDSTLTVSGELDAPSGFTFVNDDFWNDYNRLTFSLQDGGMLKLGGSVSRGVGRKGGLRFEWNGGAIQSTGNVNFVNTECVIPENARLSLEVSEGRLVDLSAFSVGTGAEVTKTGAGAVRLGAGNFANASVVISEGMLSVGEAYPASVVLKDGTCVSLDCAEGSIVFPADLGIESGAEVTLKVAVGGVAIDMLPAEFADVTFDLSRAVMDVPFITCADAQSRATLLAKLEAAVSPAQEVREVGESLVVCERKDNAFTGGEDGTVTDWNDPAGWSGGTVPEGGEISVRGEDVTVDISSTPSASRIEVSLGAKVRVSGNTVDLPEIALVGDARLEVVSGSAYLTNGLSCTPSVAGGRVSLPSLAVGSGATLNVAGGMKFRNIAIELNGTLSKSAEDGEGPVFGYAEADETSYISFVGDGGTFDVHSSQVQTDGKVDFVCPAPGGRVKALGDIVLKDMAFIVNGWRDFGFRRFGVDNPKDEPFTVMLDGTPVASPWAFIAAGAATVRLRNGGSVMKNSACANHGFDNELTDSAKVEVAGEGSYFDYAGGNGDFRIKTAGGDAMVVRDGGAYVVGYSVGTGKGTFVASNGVLGVTKQYDVRHRSDLLNGFGSARIEHGSALFVSPLDLGVGNQEWERRSVFSDIPIAGGGDLVVSNSMPDKVFTVTVVNGENSCSGLAMAIVSGECDSAAETALYFADGANWDGTVVANGLVALTNVTDSAQPANVSFNRVRLVGRLPLRAWRSADGDVVNDAISMTGGFVRDGGDIGMVEIVPQAGFALKETDRIALGTYPRGAFDGIKVKCGRRRLAVVELESEQEGMAVCVARPAGSFAVIVR